jgi:lipoprotein NlpD
VTSTFKSTDPARKGIKIRGGEGSAIVAAEGGKVVYSGSGLIGYGRLIIVKHNDNYLSAYGHNRELLVGEGDQVTKGQKIAAMGTANNGQPLLHFEIRRNGKPSIPCGCCRGADERIEDD